MTTAYQQADTLRNELARGVRGRMRRIFAVLSMLVALGLASVGTIGSPIAVSQAAETGQVSAAPPKSLDDVYRDVALQVPEFAGLFMDEDGQTYVINMTSERQDRASAARALLTTFLTDSDLASAPYRIRLVKYSFVQLKDWYDALVARAFAIDGVLSSDIDERYGLLRFGVADPGVQGALIIAEAARLQVPLDLIAIEKHPTTHLLTTLRDYWRPIIAGQEISYLDGLQFDCTLGALSTRSGVQGFITNSHCSINRGTVDPTYYGQPDTTCCVATETVDPPFFTGGQCPAGKICRYSDSLFAKLYTGVSFANRGMVAKVPEGSIVWDTVSKFRITSESQSVLNTGIAKVGRTTGKTTGTVTATCRNEDIPDVTNGLLLCQYVTSAIADEGDSGSPIIRSEGGAPNDVTLKGILWGAAFIEPGHIFVEAYYSPIRAVQAVSELGPIDFCASGFTQCAGWP